MNTYVLVDADGNAVDYVVWDGTSPWTPPAGLTLVPYQGAWQSGAKWDGQKLVLPEPPPSEAAPPEEVQ
jgi:hypothetical protein